MAAPCNNRGRRRMFRQHWAIDPGVRPGYPLEQMPNAIPNTATGEPCA